MNTTNANQVNVFFMLKHCNLLKLQSNTQLMLVSPKHYMRTSTIEVLLHSEKVFRSTDLWNDSPKHLII